MKNLHLWILFFLLAHSITACAQKPDVAQKMTTDKSGYSSPGYVDTSLFCEQELKITGDGLALPATLSVPNGKGPFAAIILVHGSGPNDRDETIFANKPFRDLAWGLASRGIAVLRYEKRSKVAPMSFAGKVFTVKEEVTDDALAGLRLLRSNQTIDPGAIYILGHSLGATLAPRIAAQDGKLKGMVIMAGTARPLEDIIAEQASYLLATDSSPAMQYQKTMLDSMSAKIRRLTSKDSLNPASVGGAPAAYFLDFRNENAPLRAASLGIRTLVLQGERDYQVTEKDFSLWQKALSGKPGAKLKTYPSLNHLFMAGEGPSTPKEYTEPNHIPKYVIDDIANWIVSGSH